MNSVKKFITEKMGSEYVHETTVNLKESYKESTAQTPLILIHSHGELSMMRDSSTSVKCGGGGASERGLVCSLPSVHRGTGLSLSIK